MSKHRVPYQCLKTCGNLLIAARGSSIESFNLRDGSLNSSWKAPGNPAPAVKKEHEEVVALVPQTSDMSVNSTNEDSAPPAKRRRLSATAEEAKVSKGPTMKKVNSRAQVFNVGLENPNVIALAVTRDCRHVIAVTGEDKSIRVLKVEGETLTEISRRVMPKRPCAVVLTEDEATIISADKFGDVYSLPLIPAEASLPFTVKEPTPESTAETPFKPSATDKTVHSKRNLRALENQKRQTNKKSEKEVPTFEHKLLLGHVSMLTDVITAKLEGKKYVITADRDEHIRVSRSIPQTHVIESYCLGHSEFVTRLCVPRGRPEVLISGGGDDELYVWEWLSGTLLSKIAVRSLVEGIDSLVSATKKLTVSGIYSTTVQDEEVVLVIFEGVPAVFIFVLSLGTTSKIELTHKTTLVLQGNALSITFTTLTSFVVAIDSIHIPGSTNTLRSASDPEIESLVDFSCAKLISGGDVQQEKTSFSVSAQDIREGSGKQVAGMLYSLGNLRKMEGGPEGSAEKEDEDETEIQE